MNMKKLLVVVAVVTVLSTVVFAASLENESVVYPYPYYGNEYPNVLVLKGVAVSDNTEPAVFVGINGKNMKFENSYLIIGSNAYDMEMKDYNYDSEKQTLVVTFKSGEDTLKLVVKQYTINYNNIAVASGTFNEKILNMKLVGEEPVYRALDTPAQDSGTITKAQAVQIANEIE